MIAAAVPARLASWPTRAAGAVARELTRPSRRPRRIFSRKGRAHIELLGPARHGKDPARVHAAVTAALGDMDGVRWAKVDEGLGRVLVAFDEDSVDVDDLIEALGSVESAFEPSEPDDGAVMDADVTDHPGDTDRIALEAVALGVDVVCAGIAALGRFSPLPALPRAASALVALVEHQPKVRGVLERRLGITTADLLLGGATVGVAALTQTLDVPLTNAVRHAARLAELTSARAAFLGRERELTAATGDADSGGVTLGEEARAPRPRPLPRGPVETVIERSAVGGLVVGAGTLAITRSPSRAGELILAAVPRAARFGREVFAAAAGRRLAARGVIPLDSASLRRMDRVDTVVVSAGALLTDRMRVLSAQSAEVWSRAEGMLAEDVGRRVFEPGEEVARAGTSRLVAAHPRGRRAAADPDGLPLELRAGRTRRSLVAGVETAPLADAVLAAARGCGRLLLTRHASARDLVPFADRLLPHEGSLATEVRRLQAEGATVLVVADTDADALHRADVGVGLARPGAAPPWSADLLCGSDLAEVWRVLLLPPAARRSSQRGATLSVSASALSGLMTMAGGESPYSLTRALGGSPVSGAALISIAEAALAVRRVDRRPPPAPAPHTAWHALPAATVVARVGARPRDPDTLPVGSPGRATHPRRATRTAGSVAAGAGRLGRAVVADLADPLVPILVLGAAASAVLGSTVDAALVAGVSLTNATVSGAQRARAEAVLSRLVARHVPLARIVTTAGPRLVPAAVLRAGDLIDVRAADVIPADARLVEADALEVDEASLTGESLPVLKGVEPTPGADLAERAGMLYEGTSVVAGAGRAVVVATGAATQAGRATAAVGGHGAPAGVQAQLGELTRLALPLTGLSGVAVTALSMIRGAPPRAALGAGVAVAVAAVPEGLPLVATVSQVAAARRLARQGILVRSSRTVEALGRVDLVCFDKTGTLTEGRLVLRRVAVRGATAAWARLPPEAPDAADLLRFAGVASPLPGAVVAHATDRAVLDAAATVASLPSERVAELPFETARGYSATAVRVDGVEVLAVKGAPEALIPRCRLDPTSRRTAVRAATDLARDGLRVLAVARTAGRPSIPDGPADAGDGRTIPDAHLRDLELLGFVGLADTPRPSAGPAVRRLAEAGLRVTMVTGDHPVTAAAIAAEVGIPDPAAVVTGPELDQLGDEEYARQVARATVFARTSPEQKVRIVNALQRAGHVVAMTGDGTNDAAAIRAADVGIAVSGFGVAAAQSSADLLLSDADVGRLCDAVFEGRRMWKAIIDAVSVLVGGNAGEIAFILLGTAIGGTSPLSPRQVLLVNVLTDMAPAMALAVRGRPGSPDGEAAGIAGGSQAWRNAALRRALATRGAATAAGATAAWTLARFTGTSARASTVGMLALVGTQLGQTLTLAGRDPLVLATALGSIAVLAVVVQTPGVSQLFGSRPVGPAGWTTAATCAAAASAGAWVYERRRRNAHPR
ncbi:MAG: HAD-IC family P-type ATPase [Frankia sp.]